MRYRTGRGSWVGWSLAILGLLVGPRVAGADNLLVNGNFEQNDGKGGAAGWGLYPPKVEGKDRGVSLSRPGYRSPQAVCVSETETPGNVGLFSRPAPVAKLSPEEVLFTCYYKTQGDPGAHLTLVGYAEPFLQKEWKTPYLQSESQMLPTTPNWSLLCRRFRFLPGVQEIVVIFRLTAGGRLYLDEASLRPYPTEVACKVTSGGMVEALPKRRLVELELTNQEAKDKNLQVVALALGENRPTVQAGMNNVRLAGEKTQTVRFNYDYDYRQAHLLRLTVQAADSPTVYDQRDLQVPGLLSAELASPAFRHSLLESVPTPKLVVAGALNVVPALRNQLKLSAELVGVTGGGFAASPESPAPPAFRWELPTPTLLSGDHVVRVTAALPQGNQQVDLPLRRVAPGLPEVGYDEQRRLWVRGKRMFPLGLYGIEDPEGLQAAVAAGFNFVVVSSPRASYEVREAAVKAGMGVVVSAASTEESFWQHLQSKWGTSPACLGWLPYSRPDLRSYSPVQVGNLYDLIARLSPGEPVFEPLASPSLAPYYTQAADILLAWSLPVPHSPLRALGEMVQVLRESGGATKPVWAIIQAQGGGAFEDEPLGPAATGRAPTAAEMEALAHLALVRGADGLVWYSYTPSEESGGSPLPQVDPTLWAAMGALNLRLRWLTPVLLDGTRQALPAAAGGAVEMARWHYQDADYVMAVNWTERGVVTPLRVGPPGAGAQVVFENRELKADQDGDLQESFPPYGVHVYRVGKAG